MTLAKKKENESEVTIVMTLNLTDILKVPSDDEKAAKMTDAEIEKIKKALKKLSCIDNVDIQRVKVFPNIKDEAK